MNEDFVSYDLAVKLKEKGFPQHICDDAYIIENEYDDEYLVGERWGIQFIPDYCIVVSAPQIAQVLKWLREREIRIDIVVYPIDRSTAFIGGEIYTISIYIDRERDIEINRNGKDKYRTYEQAALAGIEYVIDNLI